LNVSCILLYLGKPPRGPGQLAPGISPGNEQKNPRPRVHRWWMLIRQPGLDMSCATADLYSQCLSARPVIAQWQYGVLVMLADSQRSQFEGRDGTGDERLAV